MRLAIALVVVAVSGTTSAVAYDVSTSAAEAPVKRAISSQPVVKPIKVNAPNSVFALGSAFAK